MNIYFFDIFKYRSNFFIGGILKKNNLLNGLIALMVFVAIIGIQSCTGPEGPAGAPGKDGKDGADGTALCATCHNSSTELASKQAQWALSKHGQGEAFMSANRKECAACHTTEGFLETAKTKADTVQNVFVSPSTINCRTCHNIHNKFDKTDWKLTSVEPFKFRYDAKKTDVDLKDANLCARCHQARPLSPGIDDTKDSVSIASFRWGPHYGGQSNILVGHSAFSLDGSPLPSFQAHQAILNSCFKCHMSGPLGLIVGGHTFNTAFYNLETGVKTVNTAGCRASGCHTTVGGAGKNVWDVDGGTKIAEIVRDLMEVRAKLAAKGWIDTSAAQGNPGRDNVTNNWKGKPLSATNPLKLSTIEAKILANYLVVARDKSFGVHNPKYVSAVLKQTLNALQ